jgi:aspartate/methionine/tyrosine aminotransferase
MSNKVKTYGGINLAQGIPGFQPPRELLDILSDIAVKPIHQYAPGTGNNGLLKLLVDKYNSYKPLSVENFLVTNGGTEAVSLLYTYFNKVFNGNFSALAFEPVYESYKELPGIFNTGFVSFAYLEGGKVDFAELENAVLNNNVKVIFLNTPGNPFGKIWEKEEIEELIGIAEKHDIFVVMDAVYQELFFDQEPYHPINQLTERVFYVNSFSKLLSVTGWRLGYLACQKEHMDEIKAIHDYTGLSSPSVLQEALVIYLQKYNWGREYTSMLREKLQNSFYLLKKNLTDLGFSIPEIKGGFFIWAELPKEHTDGFTFTMDLYDKEKVAVIPGEHFGQTYRNYVRLNIAREKDDIAEASERIKRFIKE